MDTKKAYLNEALRFFEENDFPSLLKKTIDLSLDTEDITYYKKTVDLIYWLDNNQTDIELIKSKFKKLLDELFLFLELKETKDFSTLIEITNLTKKYNASSFYLGPLSFIINTGQIIGLVGENGNGKTTLLRCLCQELIPTSGNINFFIDHKNQYDLRTQLIYIPQRTKDWHGLLIDNLLFTASSYGIKGVECELIVELIITRMGLRQFRNFNWNGISSGYKMRFELARMLLRKPKLLLIDEPLANLDIMAQQIVLDDFRNIAKSPFRPLAIVLSSQQLYEVEKTSDHVIFLKNGKPKNLETENIQDVSELLIIEFDTDFDLEKLKDILGTIGLEKIQIRGGSYIASFKAKTSSSAFFSQIIQNNITLTYFRDISKSSRRFFIY